MTFHTSSSVISSSCYETETMLNKYLLFHYGEDKDLLPYPFGPQNSLHFPVRCVTECIEPQIIPRHAKALELGCAVGRSSFELSRYCDKVLGVDQSHSFIKAAQQLQEKGELKYHLLEEGNAEPSVRIAQLSRDMHPERVQFKCFDLMELLEKHTDQYHVILAANVLCRLSDPIVFLQKIASLVLPGGQLILTSPYSWLEEFTPRTKWIGEKGKTTLECIQEIMEESFILQTCFNQPFLIREHLRHFEWGVAQSTTWKKI